MTGLFKREVYKKADELESEEQTLRFSGKSIQNAPSNTSQLNDNLDFGQKNKST